MKNGLNFILFQALWLCCVLGAAYEVLWPAIVCITTMLVVFLFPSCRHQKDKIFLSVCILMGFILDSVLAHFNLIHYHYNFGMTQTAPVWILFLWIGFALTLNHSMTWLLNKTRLGTLFIIVGSPISYFSAEKLGAIKIYEPFITLTLISIMWLFVYHVILAINSSSTLSRELNHV